MGVAISLDDFGTGFSSLSYLKRLPIETLKIDRSFIDGLPADGNDKAIVEAILAMGHALGIKVLAEGVETAPQAEFSALQDVPRHRATCSAVRSARPRSAR